MIYPYRIKTWLSWPFIRAHACTAAVALSFNSTWRGPREAFRYGGVQYAMVLTVAMAIVALPVALLQLAIGQLSQQDAVGMWRAVPFFKGTGYLRLLISFLSAVYNIVYVALIITFMLYSFSNSIPFWECTEMIVSPEGYENRYNASACLNETFLAPVSQQPEYYIAMALIIFVLWIVFPFVLYTPVKLMKRIFYILGPTVFVLAVIIVSFIGDRDNVTSFYMNRDWIHFLEPNIWQSGLIQALWSSQIAGGYLVSAGDTIYSNTNVQWTAMVFVGTNIVSSWAGLLFWYSISGEGRDVSPVAVLIEVYRATEENSLNTVWPLLVFAMLLLSGIMTMLILLFPLYDRFRRIDGYRWRVFAVVSSLVGTVAALTVLAGRLPLLGLLEDHIVPYFISITTILEICAFIFIYGWKVLVEDVEFLTGHELSKYWVMGWCAAPGVIAPFVVWWLVTIFIHNDSWVEYPWITSSISAATALAFIIFIVFASLTVARQVQYDFIGKLKSSFKPSRHWGPRDPITHYYWLARREEADRQNIPQSRYNRRQLGQFSGGTSFLNISDPITQDQDHIITDNKQRSNSDDWIYTIYRKQNLEKSDVKRKRRSKSLDWAVVFYAKENKGFVEEKTHTDFNGTPGESVTSFREVINTVFDVKAVDDKV